MEEIASFYGNRSIFVTGGSGFLGKVLLEKLVRSCPEINLIFILLRPKKGCDIKSRMEQLLRSQVFDRVREECPEQLLKLQAIEGDLLQPSLGLSSDDLSKLIESVSIVFHAAATVSFDQPLAEAVRMNVIGTQTLVRIAKKMSKLTAIVHVSTAYCNCHQTEIREQLYPAPADPLKIIQIVECLDEETLRLITPLIIGNRPNTYTFTKALAEHVFVQEVAGLPAAIVRPSIVTASSKEPFPGWVDNMNGLSGMMAGAGKGLLHTVIGNGNMRADLVPVDMVVNLVIAVAWRTAYSHYYCQQPQHNNGPMTRAAKVMVYNSTSGSNGVKWDDICRMILQVLRQRPYAHMLSYPWGKMRTNTVTHAVIRALFQQFPALIFDLFLCQEVSLMQMQRKIQKMTEVLQFFTTHEWCFHSDNVTHLYHHLLSTKDKHEFPFDFDRIDWNQYFENYVEGVRTFLLKEKFDIAESKKHIRRLYVIHKLFQLMSVATFVGCAYYAMPKSVTPFLKSFLITSIKY